jgi:hypothetical protein
LQESVHIAQDLKRKIELLHLRQQVATKIVDPERGCGIISDWNFQLQIWYWQARLLEGVGESKAHLCIPTGTFQRLANERCASRPKRQVRGQWENGSPAWFVKGDDSAGANQSRQGLQRDNRIGKKLQNETTDYCIERFIDWKLPHIGLGEDHIVEAGLGHASSGAGDRACIAFYADYFSRRANEPGSQHCHVTNAGAKIQDTLARSDACLTEESFGERCQNHRLPNQAFMFGIGIAQRVMRGGTAR